MRWKIVNASHRRKSVCIHAMTSELSCRQILAQIFRVSESLSTPIECSAIGLLTLCLTETHTEMSTQRVDKFTENKHSLYPEFHLTNIVQIS